MSQIYGYSNLRVGEESVLPERFLGKQVYATLVDFGALPEADSEKAVAHGLTDLDQFGIDNGRSFVSQGNGSRHALFYPNTVPNAFWRAKVDADDVSIHVGEDRSAFTAMVCVWYTKASEIPDAALEDTNIAPGPEGTHLVSRNGRLVWESVLPAPVGGRIRVTEDLHVYVDGNRGASGDGLTPETAVKSYEDAVKALSLYDGGNTYKAVLHFADLKADGEYPEILTSPGHYASFVSLEIHGASHETTKILGIFVRYGSNVLITNVNATRITSENSSTATVTGKITVGNKAAANLNLFLATNSATLSLYETQVYVKTANCYAVFFASISATLYVTDSVTTIIGSLSVESAFARVYFGCLYVTNSSFGGTCIGKRYASPANGVIEVLGKGANVFPGSLAGEVASGGLYR